MMNSNAFSQTVTDTIKTRSSSPSDTTKIQLTKPIARLVIKDLVQYDGLSKEVSTLNLILTETNNKLFTQSSLVTNLQSQVLNYESIIANKNEQMINAQKATEALQKALKKERRSKKLYQVGSAIGGGALLLLLVQK